MKTSQQLKDYRDAIDAHLAGKPVEWSDKGEKWFTAHDPTWQQHLYRPKPEPKTRPWQSPEDVPGPICWLRFGCDDPEFLIVAIDEVGMSILCYEPNGQDVAWSEIELGAEYSTDRKTWHPCTVTPNNP